MGVLVVGLIVYVILSVIGEMAKKNKNAPSSQTGGGKVITFPSDPNAGRKSFQDVLREALEEASLEGKDLGEDSEGHSVGEYHSEDGYQGEGSSESYGEGADAAEDHDTWPSRRDGSLTGEEMMEPLGRGSEGFGSEGLSSEGYSSEGLSSFEGIPGTDGSSGRDTRWESLGPIQEDEHSSGSLLKSSISSAGSDEFSSWEKEDGVDFTDDYEDTTDPSDFDTIPISLKRSLLSSEDDLLRGIIVSEIMNAPGGRSRQMSALRRPNRWVRK